MKKLLFWIIFIGLILLAIYLPVAIWIIGITTFLIILSFVWIISGSEKREEERMITKFGKDYKDAIAKGKLGLQTLYPCRPDESHTSKIKIEDIAKIHLPNFSVKECKETLEDFTGDYRGEAIIEFNEPIGDSVIMQIQGAIKQGVSNWIMTGSDMYECKLAEPDLTTKYGNDMYWGISLQKDSVLGKIMYGRV